MNGKLEKSVQKDYFGLRNILYILSLFWARTKNFFSCFPISLCWTCFLEISGKAFLVNWMSINLSLLPEFLTLKTDSALFLFTPSRAKEKYFFSFYFYPLSFIAPSHWANGQPPLYTRKKCPRGFAFFFLERAFCKQGENRQRSTWK